MQNSVGYTSTKKNYDNLFDKFNVELSTWGNFLNWKK